MKYYIFLGWHLHFLPCPGILLSFLLRVQICGQARRSHVVFEVHIFRIKFTSAKGTKLKMGASLLSQLFETVVAYKMIKDKQQLSLVTYIQVS